MAGKATDHATVRDTASSPAHATDASTVLHQPANAAASTRPNIPPTARLTRWKIAQPPTPPTMPMLKMFAPSAVMPPSANIRHCTISTDAMTITADAGPQERRHQHAADQVAGRATGHREVDHLRREHERRRQPQQRHALRRQVLARLPQRDAHARPPPARRSRPPSSRPGIRPVCA